MNETQSLKMRFPNRTFRCIAVTGVICVMGIFAIPVNAVAEGLTIKVFTSTPEELNVTSALIMGKKEMVVVSAQAAKSSASRLADEIEATGLELKAVFLTHAHFDHAIGASVLKKRFPNTRFLATPDVAAFQRVRAETHNLTSNRVMGENSAAPSVLFQDYNSETIEVDGEIIEIRPGYVGDVGGASPDEPHTVLFVPSLNALIPSDIVYNDGHVMMGGTTRESRAKWIAQIEGWLGEDYRIVVPGHQPATSKLEPRAALTHTRDYIIAYGEEIERAKTADELVGAMVERFPDIGHQVALRFSALRDFKQVEKLGYHTFDPLVTDEERKKIADQIMDAARDAANDLSKDPGSPVY